MKKHQRTQYILIAALQTVLFEIVVGSSDYVMVCVKHLHRHSNIAAQKAHRIASDNI